MFFRRSISLASVFVVVLLSGSFLTLHSVAEAKTLTQPDIPTKYQMEKYGVTLIISRVLLNIKPLMRIWSSLQQRLLEHCNLPNISG
jgi:hypothetical protein